MKNISLLFTKANQQQIIEAFRNVHEIWPHHQNLEEHIASRLKSPRHLKADWFAGLHRDQVVTSLARYSLGFTIFKRQVIGIGIGAVHTKCEYRNQGFARKLLDYVLALSKKQGAEVALLYSDIDPAYYKRSGFIEIKSHSFKASINKEDEKCPSSLSALEVAFDDYFSDFSHLYNRQKDHIDFFIARDRNHWDWLNDSNVKTKYVAVTQKDQPGTFLGYFAYVDHTDHMEIKEYLIFPQYRKEELFYLMYSYAIKNNYKYLVGWYAGKEYSKWLGTRPREKEIPMIAALIDEPLSLENSTFSLFNSDHF